MPSPDRQNLLFITIISSIFALLPIQADPMKEQVFLQVDSSAKMGEENLDLDDFEEILTTDTSLFKAFQNLRFADYSFSNVLIFHKEDHKEPGVYNSINHQSYIDSCRSMDVVEEVLNRNFYKSKGNHRFQTAKLYDSLFYTHAVVCREEPNKPMIQQLKNKSRIDHYTDQLKVLVFRPGTQTDLPFIGAKTAIFSEDLKDYYTFELKSIFYKGRPAYAFKASPKSYLTAKQKNKLAIQNLVTYLDKDSQQVLFRQYHVKMSNWIFDCDIKMQIDVQQIEDRFYPQRIQYDGHWDIIGVEEEKGKFEVSFFDFRK